MGSKQHKQSRKSRKNSNIRRKTGRGKVGALRWKRELALLSVLAVTLGLLLALISGSPPADDPARSAASHNASAVDVPRVTQPSNGIARSGGSPAVPQPPAATSGAVGEPATQRFPVALIIDDIGNSDAAGRRAIDLPADITFAVLPHTLHGRVLADYAHRQGREVMLHMPMSNSAQMPIGTGGLTPDLALEDFNLRLQQALADVPHVRGVNNHMGSELTALRQPMQWLMQQLQQEQLYFVDSYTSAESIAVEVAREHHIPSARRHVFLDHSIDPEEIHFQFQRLLETARRDGYAVGIGHPYPETLDYLEQALPALADSDIEWVFVSELLTRNGFSLNGLPAD